eukprot:gene14123-9879_t
MATIVAVLAIAMTATCKCTSGARHEDVMDDSSNDGGDYEEDDVSGSTSDSDASDDGLAFCGDWDNCEQC